MYARDGGGGGSQDGFHGDFDAMGKIGTAADDIGNAVVELAKYSADASASVQENHPGWAISGALKKAQAECEFNVQGLGRAMCDMGDGVQMAIGTYQGADTDAVDKLNAAGGSQ